MMFLVLENLALDNNKARHALCFSVQYQTCNVFFTDPFASGVLSVLSAEDSPR